MDNNTVKGVLKFAAATVLAVAGTTLFNRAKEDISRSQIDK